MGPQPGVAAADSTESASAPSSPSAGSDARDAKESTGRSPASRRHQRHGAADAAAAHDSGDADRDIDSEESAAEPQAFPTMSSQTARQRRVAEKLDRWTTNHEARVDAREVSDDRKEQLNQSFLAVRRTLFNQAPVVAPIQITGVIDGPVTGTIGASDADGDHIGYRVVGRPREGTVQLAADGTYTYTPDADFDGVDTFRVLAIDRGFHVNLLNPLRPRGTRATSLINQGAIGFDFDYTDAGTDWTPERRQALEETVLTLLEYFRVKAPVRLSYDVKVEEDDALASAQSPLLREKPGYWRTVVQHKLITGIDANGAVADGEIYWNFADFEWGLGDTVGSQEYDFVSTVLHEVVHSFGFIAVVSEPGDNDERDWSIFTRFIVTADRARPIDARYRWRSAADPALTGGDGGLFFNGPQATGVYGGPVPLYTPDPWEPGSSVTHLDDHIFTGADQKIMNARTDTGLGVRVFSPVELAMLADLGYRVVPPQSPPYGTDRG